jgi:cytochrome c oxidase subunit 2
VATATVGGCRAAATRTDAVSVRLVSQDTSWRASYLILASQGEVEVETGRDVHVPLGADVRLTLASRDYISDFQVPELGLRDFAAPGLPSEFHFRASRIGRYDLRGDELCGRPHTDRTRGTLTVEAPAAYQTWVRSRTRGRQR